MHGQQIRNPPPKGFCRDKKSGRRSPDRGRDVDLSSRASELAITKRQHRGNKSSSVGATPRIAPTELVVFFPRVLPTFRSFGPRTSVHQHRFPHLQKFTKPRFPR